MCNRICLLNTALNGSKIIQKIMYQKFFVFHFQSVIRKFGYTKYNSVSVTESVATELIFFDINWWTKN